MKEDKFGRVWSYPDEELCNKCSQPDNTGDCNHEKLSPDEVIQILHGKE